MPASPVRSPLSAKDKVGSQAGALASKPAWTLRLDLGQGEVVVAARNQRAKAMYQLRRTLSTWLNAACHVGNGVLHCCQNGVTKET